MNEYLQVGVNGIVIGSIIALGAAGLTLVYGILKIVNFAHGDYLTFGAYMAFVANIGWGLHPLVAGAAAVALTVVLSLMLELGLWRPMRGRGAGVTSLFLTSIGLALIMRNSITWIWGGIPRRYTVDIFQSYDLGPILISRNEITILATAAVGITALGLFLARTRTGKAMRALSDNRDLASVSGIDPNRIVIYTWILAGALAAVAGMLQAIKTSIDPQVGWFLLLPIFAAVILGGVGNAYGALAGGIVLGLAMEYSTFVFPATYRNAVAFAVMIAALLVRPQGLLGRARLLG